MSTSRPERPAADAGRGVLAGKKVVLGVCGGIAAYKAVEICRRLGDAGAFVSPVLTEDATRFVGALTFSALAAEPARTSLFSADGAGPGGEPVPHVALGRSADAVVVVPATARLIGSYAGGVSSDLLTATLLATRAPVLLCPAMHAEMWGHPAVQDNVSLLRRRGVHVLEPAEGRLAGGDFGAGRLPGPEEIMTAVVGLFGDGMFEDGMFEGPAVQAQPLRGVRAVVSAGGTREPLDPVRYVGNRSSGKQGYAVAAELVKRGAQVTLVSSCELVAPVGAEVERVETAAQMADAVLGASTRAEVVVMAAAVADYRPAAPAEHKWKKSAAPLSVELVPTMDILAELGARRRAGQVLVGFAAETADGGELASLGRSKLVSKNADLIVANAVGAQARAEGAGFGQNRSRAVIVSRGSTVELGVVDKQAVAAALVDAVVELLAAGRAPQREEGTNS